MLASHSVTMRNSTQPLPASLLALFIQYLFKLLYHQMAFLYDLVANMVSIGRWNDWILSVLPYLSDGQILEIGYGTGILQSAMHNTHLNAYGIDESQQMGKRTKARLMKNGYQPKIILAEAEFLPYPDCWFNQIVTTFPSEFIIDTRTLLDIQRILQDEGELIILPYAWIRGHEWYNQLAAWLFRITGQVPEWSEKFETPFKLLGFEVEVHQIDLPSSTLPIFLAKKSNSKVHE